MCYILSQYCALYVIPCIASADYKPSEKDAIKLINDTSMRSLNVMRSNRPDSMKRQKLIQIFKEVVDIDWIARFVIAKHWRSLDETTKERYLNVYRDYLTASYVPLFSKYNGQEYEINQSKTLRNNQYLVKMLIS